MSAPIPHHLALGIHRGAFVQDSTPDTSDVQDGVLWIDTSVGPPYQLKRWHAEAATWRPVQMDATGYPLPAGHRVDSVAGLGTPVLSSVQARHLNTRTRVLSLWTPTGNLAPPAGWDVPPLGTMGTAMLGDVSIPSVSPAEIVWTSHVANSPQDIIARAEFTLPEGTVVSAQLQCACNDTFLAVHVNGTSVPFSGLEAELEVGMDIDPAPFLAGAANVLAFWCHSDAVTVDANNSGITWSLTIGVAPAEEKLRLSHATAGDQVLFPLALLAETPAVLLGQDPETGLPALCPVLQARAQTTAEEQDAERVDVPEGYGNVQIKCGVAAALRDEVRDEYQHVSTILNAGVQTLGETFATSLIGTGSPAFRLLFRGLKLQTRPWLRNAVRLALKAAPGMTGSALAAEVSTSLDDTQLEFLRKTCFCSLTVSGNQITLTKAMLLAWQDAVVSSGTSIFSGVVRDIIGGIILTGATIGLPWWSDIAQAGAGLPIHDCDDYVCS